MDYREQSRQTRHQGKETVKQAMDDFCQEGWMGKCLNPRGEIVYNLTPSGLAKAVPIARKCLPHILCKVARRLIKQVDEVLAFQAVDISHRPRENWTVEQDCASAIIAAAQREATTFGTPFPPVGWEGAVRSAMILLAGNDLELLDFNMETMLRDLRTALLPLTDITLARGRVHAVIPDTATRTKVPKSSRR